MKAYWQIAAGNATQGRDYSDLFLRYGMAFVGGDKQVALMREVKEGDIVILKVGLHKIKAVGVVVARNGSAGGVDDKPWVRDVEGWDLRAYRYVEWHLPARTVDTDSLTRTTISRCHHLKHKRIADEILRAPAISASPEPIEQPVIGPAEMAHILSAQWLAVDQSAFRARLESWAILYRERFADAMKWKGDDIRRNLVRPLLASLGWSDHELTENIHGRRLGHVLCAFIDTRSVLPIVCRPWYHGLDLNDDQALACASRFVTAKALIVTNGIAYKLYLRDPSSFTFSTAPEAYCSVVHLTERCSSDPSMSGAPTVLSFLLPHTIP